MKQIPLDRHPLPWPHHRPTALVKQLHGLRLTDAVPADKRVAHFLDQGDLTQESLQPVLQWCCDTGESQLLDKALAMAETAALQVGTVSMTTADDEHAAAVLNVLAGHAAVQSIDLFRSTDADAVVPAAIGPRATAALEHLLLGSADRPSHLRHLGVAPAGLDQPCCRALAQALQGAPALKSFTFVYDEATGAPMSAYDALALVFHACRNRALDALDVTLRRASPSRDQAAGAIGPALAQALLCSHLAEARLCCNAETLGECARALGAQGQACTLASLTLVSTAPAQTLARLYMSVLSLVRHAALKTLKVDGISVADSLPLARCIAHAEAEPETDDDDDDPEADAKAAQVPALECTLVSFEWTGALPAAYRDYIEAALDRPAAGDGTATAAADAAAVAALPPENESPWAQAPEVAAGMLQSLRKTDAQMPAPVKRLFEEAALDEGSLPAVVAWCCDTGEPAVLHEVLRRAEALGLAVHTVSVAASQDEHTAAVLEVLGRHAGVKAVDLFRRQDDGTTVGAVVGPRAARALKEMLRGTPALPAHVTHLGLSALRFEPGQREAVLRTLHRALCDAPALLSCELGCEGEPVDGTSPVPVEKAVHGVMTLVAGACRNPAVWRLSLVLPGFDEWRALELGLQFGQAMLGSHVRDLQLQCAARLFLAGCLYRLAQFPWASPLTAITLHGTSRRAAARRPEVPALWPFVRALIQESPVLAIQAQGLGHRDLEGGVHDISHPLIGPPGAAASAPGPGVAALQGRIVLYAWPGGFRDEHSTLIEQAVGRNRAAFHAAHVPGHHYGRAIGHAFGGLFIKSHRDADAAWAAATSNAHSGLTVRDLMALDQVNTTVHNAGQRMLSREFAQQIVTLVQARRFADLHDLAVRLQAAGMGLLQEDQDVIWRLAREEGVAHELPPLPMATPSRPMESATGV